MLCLGRRSVTAENGKPVFSVCENKRIRHNFASAGVIHQLILFENTDELDTCESRIGCSMTLARP